MSRIFCVVLSILAINCGRKYTTERSSPAPRSQGETATFESAKYTATMLSTNDVGGVFHIHSRTNLTSASIAPEIEGGLFYFSEFSKERIQSMSPDWGNCSQKALTLKAKLGTSGAHLDVTVPSNVDEGGKCREWYVQGLKEGFKFTVENISTDGGTEIKELTVVIRPQEI